MRKIVLNVLFKIKKKQAHTESKTEQRAIQQNALKTFITSFSLATFELTYEIDDDEMEDDVRKDEIRKSAFRTDSSELILVGRIDLKIWF